MKGSVTRQTPKHLLKWTAIDSHLFHSGWCCSSSYICICDGLFVIWPGRTASQLHRLPRTGTSRTGCYRMLSSCLCFKQVSRKQQSCEWPLAELAASLLQSCDIRKKSSLCSHLFVCQLLALTIFKTTRIMKARCFQVQHKDSIKISWHCSMNISFLRVHLCFHVVHVADMTPSSILLSDPPPPRFPTIPLSNVLCYWYFSPYQTRHKFKCGVWGFGENIFISSPVNDGTGVFLRMPFSLWKPVQCFPSILRPRNLKRNNQRPFWISLWENSGREVTSLSWCHCF